MTCPRIGRKPLASGKCLRGLKKKGYSTSLWTRRIEEFTSKKMKKVVAKLFVDDKVGARR